MNGELILRCGDFSYSVEPHPVQWPAGASEPSVCGLAERDGALYVASRNPLWPVMVFGAGGGFLRGFGRELQFGRTHGLQLEEDGSVFVCDDGRHVIHHLDAEGTLLSTLGTLDQPSDNGYDPSVPWPHDLYTVRRAGEPFNRPTGITRAADGRLYIADGYGNAAVHRFSPEGKHEKTWGGPGSEPGKLRLPHAIREDGRGRIWVCDRENFRVQIYGADGSFIHGIERMDRPSDCWFDGAYMYVIEAFGFLSVYDMDFGLAARIGYAHSMLENAHSITGDRHGNLYVGYINGARTLIRLKRI